jgi:hypothetical protein
MAVADSVIHGNQFDGPTGQIAADTLHVALAQFPSGAVIRAPVLPVVQCSADAEIFEFVVQSVIVKMPDQFRWSEFAAQKCCHNEPVNKVAFSANADALVVVTAYQGLADRASFRVSDAAKIARFVGGQMWNILPIFFVFV